MRLNVLHEGIPPYNPTGHTGEQYNDELALEHLREGKPMCLLTKDRLNNNLRSEIADGSLGVVHVNPRSVIVYRPEFEDLALRMAGFIRLMRGRSDFLNSPKPEFHVIQGLAFGYAPEDIDKFLQKIGMKSMRDKAWAKARDFLGSWFDKLVRI